MFRLAPRLLHPIHRNGGLAIRRFTSQPKSMIQTPSQKATTMTTSHFVRGTQKTIVVPEFLWQLMWLAIGLDIGATGLMAAGGWINRWLIGDCSFDD